MRKSPSQGQVKTPRLWWDWALLIAVAAAAAVADAGGQTLLDDEEQRPDVDGDDLRPRRQDAALAENVIRPGGSRGTG
ncbi:hypothetical protein GA0070607_4665 [Micromonospora coriariae]|uniref:Uncharacterized protein n=1 Tax=Micromonospora coriariae TaxID=285665 RepID=A0A1C4X4N0_9ACTN|nr:hypothetical protein [Micromonospora coriariae]SCF03378.1 hypothetical protein GA0070607_4665 [Micromonospora coriariae]